MDADWVIFGPDFSVLKLLTLVVITGRHRRLYQVLHQRFLNNSIWFRGERIFCVLSCIVNYKSDFFSEFFPFFLPSVNDIRFMTRNIERSSYDFRQTNEEIYDYDSWVKLCSHPPDISKNYFSLSKKIICNFMFIDRLHSCFIKYFNFTWYEVGLWDEWILRAGVRVTIKSRISPVVKEPHILTSSKRRIIIITVINGCVNVAALLYIKFLGSVALSVIQREEKGFAITPVSARTPTCTC